MRSFHTAQCIKERTKHLIDQLEYKLKYPGVCMTCGGSGTIEWQDDPSGGDPPGAGWLTFHDDCTCIEYGMCPRCAEFFDQDQMSDDGLKEGEECKKCGWKRDKVVAIYPEDYECNCGESIYHERVNK